MCQGDTTPASRTRRCALALSANSFRTTDEGTAFTHFTCRVRIIAAEPRADTTVVGTQKLLYGNPE